MDLVDRLSAAIAQLGQVHKRVLVGIDGPTASGKTTLADRLGAALPMPSVRASLDGFHRPREHRYRRGTLSAEGYYHDAFDYPTLLETCLIPFREGATMLHTAHFDHHADAVDPTPVAEIPARAALIVDGVFLHRRQLRDAWTLSVYLRVSPQETLRRARVRDLELFGSQDEVDRRYLARYLPAQSLYGSEADPEAIAHIVVDNDRVDAPTTVRWSVPGD